MSKIEIMCIAENTQIANRFSTLLAKTDLQVDYMKSPQKALTKLRERRPKVLILDDQNQELDTENFLVEFSHLKHWEDIRILLCTVNDVNKADFFSIACFGVNGVICKKETDEKMIKKVRQLYSSEI